MKSSQGHSKNLVELLSDGVVKDSNIVANTRLHGASCPMHYVHPDLLPTRVKRGGGKTFDSTGMVKPAAYRKKDAVEGITLKE